LNYLTIILNKSLLFELLDRFNASYTKKILFEAANLISDLWLYLIIGIILTTLLKTYFPKDHLASFFIHHKHTSIFMAAIIGIISPLGSYVIIPLSVGLVLTGIPLHTVTALLISSPLINPNLFLLTSGAFGYPMALARTISAFLIGVITAYLILWLTKKGFISTKNSVRDSKSFSTINGDSTNEFNWKYFLKETLKMSKYVGKYFMLSIFLAAIIKILFSNGVTLRFTDNNFLSVLLSTSAGIPFYMCGGAAIPIVQQLADLGLSKGAALSFFISGPITRLSNIILLGSLYHKRFLVIYFGTGIACALIIGLIYNTL